MSKQKSLAVEPGTEIPSNLNTNEMVVVCAYAGEGRPSNADALDESLLRACESLMSGGEFEGKEEATLRVRVAGYGSGAWLLLVGLGARADFDVAALRRVAGAAVREARSAGARRLHFIAPETDGDARLAVRAVAEGACLGTYENDFYQEREEERPDTEAFVIVTNERGDELGGELERAGVVAEATNWARSLVDEPGLSLPPREFARRAAEMAVEFGLVVESLTAEEIRARGMGALAAVGQGSDEEPAMIVLRYEPEGATADDELWAFVGKGITFDTGGISIKHGLDTYEMKSDMAGGAAALAALRAAARLKLRQRVVAVVPSAENMPSGRAVKPGDVVRTFAGYTIEVVDTDAEGRLVLADGIAYARSLGASRIVDLATLTGSIIAALGDHRTGLFSNDDEWADAVRRASERAGEPTWRMPVSDDYKKKIESMIADFKNYGGRPDATAAALLLSKFAGDTPWVHLDIAGTSWNDDPLPHAPKGATGVGVRTLVELLAGD